MKLTERKGIVENEKCIDDIDSIELDDNYLLEGEMFETNRKLKVYAYRFIKANGWFPHNVLSKLHTIEVCINYGDVMSEPMSALITNIRNKENPCPSNYIYEYLRAHPLSSKYSEEFVKYNLTVVKQ